MSEIWIPAAGGGADLDVVTAQAGDVLQDKVIVGPDGEPLTGTMPNRGNYNGSGNSKGNDTGNQRMWVKIPQGYYNENAQVFLSWADIRQMAGITADKIKKNVSIIGITGTFEGWVPTPQDLYYNGVNSAGFIIGDSRNWQFQNTKIQCLRTDNITTVALIFKKTYDVRSYSKLILEGRFVSYSNYYDMVVGLSHSSQPYTNQVVKSYAASITLNIEALTTISMESNIIISDFESSTYINRIRLA